MKNEEIKSIELRTESKIINVCKLWNIRDIKWGISIRNNYSRIRKRGNIRHRHKIVICISKAKANYDFVLFNSNMLF